MKLARASVLGALAAAVTAAIAAPPEDASLRHARRLLSKHILIDGSRATRTTSRSR